MMGTAYVRGLESTRARRDAQALRRLLARRMAARNHAPVAIGPRTLRDVILLAVRDGDPRGRRALGDELLQRDRRAAGRRRRRAADRRAARRVGLRGHRRLGLLVDRVPAQHAPGRRHAGEAGALSLAAGIDVELPHTRCYGEPLAELVRAGAVPEALVDRAARRVLRQKAELGLLDADWSPEPAMADGRAGHRPARAPRARARARRALGRAAGQRRHAAARERPSVALVGPCADDPLAVPRLLLVPQPRRDGGPSGHGARDRGPDAAGRAARRAGRRHARARARLPDAGARPVAARGRRSDAAARGRRCASPWSATAPGCSGAAPPARAATPRTSRCPASRTSSSTRCSRPARRSCSSSSRGGRTRSAATRAGVAAAVQAFLPGEEGGPAIAGVLSGRVVPTGKLPVQIPRSAGRAAEHVPAPVLGGNSGGVSNIDPTPLFAFGHGLVVHDVRVLGLHASAPTRSRPTARSRSRASWHNAGDRAGAEVVQLYIVRPGRAGHPAGDRARRLRARRARAGRADARDVHRCTPTARRSRASTCAGSSSRARSSRDRRVERGHPRAAHAPAHRRRARGRSRPRADDSGKPFARVTCA